MANHPNRSRRHRVQITLLGGYPAEVDWRDGNDEGAIVCDRIFTTYIHEHTRRNAVVKAQNLAPHVTDWIFVAE